MGMSGGDAAHAVVPVGPLSSRLGCVCGGVVGFGGCSTGSGRPDEKSRRFVGLLSIEAGKVGHSACMIARSGESGELPRPKALPATLPTSSRACPGSSSSFCASVRISSGSAGGSIKDPVRRLDAVLRSSVLRANLGRPAPNNYGTQRDRHETPWSAFHRFFNCCIIRV